MILLTSIRRVRNSDIKRFIEISEQDIRNFTFSFHEEVTSEIKYTACSLVD